MTMKVFAKIIRPVGYLLIASTIILLLSTFFWSTPFQGETLAFMSLLTVISAAFVTYSASLVLHDSDIGEHLFPASLGALVLTGVMCYHWLWQS